MSTKYEPAILEADTLLRTLDIYQEVIAQLKWNLEAGEDLIAEKELETYIFPSRLQAVAEKHGLDLKRFYLNGHRSYDIASLLRLFSALFPYGRSRFYESEYMPIFRSEVEE